MPAPTSAASRKRTRSRNLSESNPHDPTAEQATSTVVSSLPTDTAPLHAPPKRARHSSSTSRNNFGPRNRSSAPVASEDPSTSAQRYNLRPRPPPPQVRTVEEPTIVSHAAPLRAISTAGPPRQYRLLYLSDEDDQPNTSQPSTTLIDTTFNLVNSDENLASNGPRRTSRYTSGTGLHTRSRIMTDPSSSTAGTSTSDNPDFPPSGVTHVRLNRAIEIVIDSIQSLEGAVNNFDQLVFGLIYGRLSSRTEFESIEGMIRLSRILNLNFPSRLTQAEIDALPTMKFSIKSESISSVLLMEKCPICLTEFTDQEVINKLHCTHLFHQPCISTWLSENDSCPTCRRKVNGD